MLRITDIVMLALLLTCVGCLHSYTVTAGNTRDGLIVTSTAFKDGGMIPVQFTHDGQGISPPIAWSGIPPKTASFALIVDDPDAPNGTYVHWVLFNIPASVSKLDANSPNKRSFSNGMVSGSNDQGQFGYTPPNPPSGTHRYYFKVYALDSMLKLNAGAGKAKLEEAMRGHILASGQLMGRYQRAGATE